MAPSAVGGTAATGMLHEPRGAHGFPGEAVEARAAQERAQRETPIRRNEPENTFERVREPALVNPFFTRYATLPGPLGLDMIGVDDVVQGLAINDCHFAAVVAAIALFRPDLLRRSIHENGDGSVSVNFFARNDWGDVSKGFHRIETRISRQVVVDAWGVSCLGHSPGGSLWYSLLEKAYAKAMGGYQMISRGGMPSDAFEALLGRAATTMPSDADELFARLEEDTRTGEAANVVWSKGGALFFSGVADRHCYTVVAANEENGERWVTVRNPWGWYEPGALARWQLFSADGKNDGVFRVPLKNFLRVFSERTRCAFEIGSPPQSQV